MLVLICPNMDMLEGEHGVFVHYEWKDKMDMVQHT